MTGNIGDDWRERLRSLMAERGLDMRSLSRKAGLGDTYVRDAIKRGRGGSIEGMASIASVLGVSVDFLMHGIVSRSSTATIHADDVSTQLIRVLGDVAAGVWVEEAMAIAEADAPVSVFPADPRYPIAAQYDLTVRGTSLNKVARDGDMLRCVDIAKAGIEVRDGDLVIVRRTQGHLVELTCKKVRRRASGRVELWPDSTDPRWQEPVTVGGEDAVEIVALALYSYVPLTLR